MHTFAQKPKAIRQTKSVKSTHPAQALSGQSRGVNSILDSQRTTGNQAVMQLLQNKTEDLEGGPLQGKSTASRTPVQFQGGAHQAENQTGLPSPLKAGLEALSGMDLSGVRVHNNSSKPAQLNALAYTQGQDIHVGPGQEKHLPHEGWHAVQQLQGRVTPTVQAKGMSINDNAGLEREADAMGEKALRVSPDRGKAKISGARPIALVTPVPIQLQRYQERIHSLQDLAPEPPLILDISIEESLRDREDAREYITDFYRKADDVHDRQARAMHRAIHKFHLSSTIPSGVINVDVFSLVLNFVIDALPVTRAVQQISKGLKVAVRHKFFGEIASKVVKGTIKYKRAVADQQAPKGRQETLAAIEALDALSNWDTNGGEAIGSERDRILEVFDKHKDSPYWRGRLVDIVKTALGPKPEVEEGYYKKFEDRFEYELYKAFYSKLASIETITYEDARTGKLTEDIPARRIEGIPRDVKKRLNKYFNSTGPESILIYYLMKEWRLELSGPIRRRTKFKDIFRRRRLFKKRRRRLFRRRRRNR